MVPLLAAPFVFALSPAAKRAVLGLDWLIWGVFAADLAIRTYLAPDRLKYLARNWLDVLIVLLPFLRPLRAVRALRVVRVIVYVLRASRTARILMARRGVHGSLMFAGVALSVSALVVFYVERDAAGTIDGLDAAVWWALATVTTVGYGDTYPVTMAGRGVATFLMLVGIGLFGVLTAQVAAYFVESSRGEPDNNKMDAVLTELREIRRRLDAQRDDRQLDTPNLRPHGESPEPTHAGRAGESRLGDRTASETGS